MTSYTTFAFQVTVLPVSIMAWIRNRREIKVGPMIKIGYARVSSIDQNLDRQIAALRVEGCEKIYREKASGKEMRNRPELSKAIDALPTKGVLVVSPIGQRRPSACWACMPMGFLIGSLPATWV